MSRLKQQIIVETASTSTLYFNYLFYIGDLSTSVRANIVEPYEILHGAAFIRICMFAKTKEIFRTKLLHTVEILSCGL